MVRRPFRLEVSCSVDLGDRKNISCRLWVSIGGDYLCFRGCGKPFFGFGKQFAEFGQRFFKFGE